MVSFRVQNQTSAQIATSHLVKHTANVITSSLRSSRVFVMVVHLRSTHTHARLLGWCSHTGGVGHTRRRWPIWPCHVVAMRCCYCLAVVHLGHPPYSSTPQSRVLVAVTPAVDGSLDQPTLATQARVQLRQCPADGVALGLVVQAVTFVLLLVAACARVDAVLSFEVLGQLVDVDRLNIAADGVLHLHPVAAVLERDPLHAILILADNQWRSRRNWSRCSIGVHICG